MIKKFRAATRDEKGQLFALCAGCNEALIKTTVLYTNDRMEVAYIKNLTRQDESREAESFMKKLITAMSCSDSFNCVLKSWQALKTADKGTQFWCAKTQKYKIFLRVTARKAEFFVTNKEAMIPSISHAEERETTAELDAFLDASLARLEQEIRESPASIDLLSRRYAYLRLIANELKKGILSKEEQNAIINGNIALDEVTSCFIALVIKAGEEGQFTKIIRQIIKDLNERGENNGC